MATKAVREDFLLPASPQDSFSAVAAIRLPPEPKRTSGSHGRGSIFSNGSLSMLARRRIASGVRLSNFAIASTLFALRISSCNLFSSSGVHGGVGVAVISTSPSVLNNSLRDFPARKIVG